MKEKRVALALLLFASLFSAHSQNLAAQDLLEKKHAPGIPDIVGFSLGMPGEVAEKNFQALYHDLKRKVLLQKFKLDPDQTSFLGFAAPSEYKLADDEDDIVLMFSGTASFNQLLYISRDAIFPPGRRPSRADTVAAILKKYGPPSVTTENELQFWFYRGLNKTDGNCAAAAVKAASVKRPSQGGTYSDYRDNAAAAAKLAPSDCDGVVVVSLRTEPQSSQLVRFSTVAIEFRNIEATSRADDAVFQRSKQQPNSSSRGTAPVPKL